MRNENKLKFQKQQARKSNKGSGGMRVEKDRERGGDYQPQGNCNWALGVGGQRDSEKLWAKYIRNLHKLTAGISVLQPHYGPLGAAVNSS